MLWGLSRRSSLRRRVPWPTREEAIRRIERRSGVAHRPATSYEDTLTAFSDNPATQTLWQAHRERLARAIQRLRVGRPSPRADRFDPMAIRALALLVLLPTAALVSGSLYDRIASAFRFGKGTERLDTRVDAWVTPPAYTAMPPIMLADGSQPVQPANAEGKAKLLQVPQKSTLTLRGTGFRGTALALEILETGAKEPSRVGPDVAKEKSDKLDIAEVRFELKNSARVRALAGSEELGSWTFDVIPDELPKITLNKDFNHTLKGSLKLSYAGEDDYGISGAVAKVRQLKAAGGDPAKAWARAAPLKGPRLPLERPPVLNLKIPRTGDKKFEASSLLDLGSHPWAGQMVELWLEATDVAGQVGKSESVQLALPARRFSKPLARALIEQRRKLAEDSRNRPTVVRALDALAIEPEGFIEKASIYLGLRSVYHRLERENTRGVINSAIAQLWDLALKIEDGALSDAEKDLKDAQDRLSKALENGASEEEIKSLMQELKQAMNKYLEEMQKNAEKDGENGDDQPQGDKRQLTQEDIDQMMRDLEESAKNGSREEAERLLAEMREMMESMRAGQKSAEEKESEERAKEMMKKLDQLSDMSGKQQKLMDDTFDQQRSEQGESPKSGQKGQKGKNGGPNQMRQQGKAGDKMQPGGPNDSKEAGQGQRGNSQQQRHAGRAAPRWPWRPQGSPERPAQEHGKTSARPRGVGCGRLGTHEGCGRGDAPAPRTRSRRATWKRRRAPRATRSTRCASRRSKWPSRCRRTRVSARAATPIHAAIRSIVRNALKVLTSATRSRCRTPSTRSGRARFWKNCASARARPCARRSSSTTSNGS